MNDTSSLSITDRALLEIVYRLMGQRGGWPTFTAVDLRADRELGIEDAQAALASIPSAYLAHSRLAHGYYDNDEVRLRLRGVAECEGGLEDLTLLEQLVQWIVYLEQNDTGEAEVELIATSQAFAKHIGVTLDLPIESGPGNDSPDHQNETDSVGSRIENTDGVLSSSGALRPPGQIADTRARFIRLRVLADLLPGFWNAAGWQTDTPWLWQYSVDRKRVRPYRRRQNLEQLLEYVDEVERERRIAAVALTRSVDLIGDTDFTNYEMPQAVSTDRTELDVLLTLLREEIAEAAADLVRADRYDDAIFAGLRRVEHELQQRTGKVSIGDRLIREAFLESTKPVRISDRAQDGDRMVQLFGGALGLFKGDRSHKDRPLVPCRSLRECLRILAHASALLDLLDRDVDKAPIVRGYEHQQGDTLTLWVERAGAQVEVWLDETELLDKISFRPGTAVVDITEIPTGEHRIHLVEGTRQGPAHTVWITRNPGQRTWLRVVEINVPLYADSAGTKLHDVAGVRLERLTDGIRIEQVLPTKETFEVGHYVERPAAPLLSGFIGSAWVRDRADGPLREAFVGAFYFDGQPVAPAHDERLMRITLEPARLCVRGGDKVPLRVLGHFTDGTANWTRQLDDPEVISSDEKVAAFKNGAVFAKAPGTTTLRCLHEQCYAEAVVEVAAYPHGTVTDYVTGLAPVHGLAWTPGGLMITNGSTHLHRVDTGGVYRLAAAVPQSPAWLADDFGGAGLLSARADGELAVGIRQNDSILVLHAEDGYQSSREIRIPEEGRQARAFVWDGADLIVASHRGTVYRLAPTGSLVEIAAIDGEPVGMAHAGDAVLVSCLSNDGQIKSLKDYARQRPMQDAERKSQLWRIPLGGEAATVDLLRSADHTGILLPAWTGSKVLLSDGGAGTLLELRDGRLKSVFTQLSNPGAVTVSALGEVFVAEITRGSIRRILK